MDRCALNAGGNGRGQTSKLARNKRLNLMVTNTLCPKPGGHHQVALSLRARAHLFYHNLRRFVWSKDTKTSRPASRRHPIKYVETPLRLYHIASLARYHLGEIGSCSAENVSFCRGQSSPGGEAGTWFFCAQEPVRLEAGTFLCPEAKQA